MNDNDWDERCEIIRRIGLTVTAVIRKIEDNEWGRFADVGKIMTQGMESVLRYSPNTTFHDFARDVKRELKIHLNGPIVDRDNPKLNYIFKKIDDWVNNREPDVASLYEYMQVDEEKKPMLLDRLRKLINGKKGKDVALTFLVCEHRSLMTRPPHKILASVFGDIGSKQGYNEYYKKGLNYFTCNEINSIEKQLSNFLIVDN